jgi:hypothetical protein
VSRNGQPRFLKDFAISYLKDEILVVKEYTEILTRKLYQIEGDSYIAGESICGQIFDRLTLAIEKGEFGVLRFGQGVLGGNACVKGK